MMFSNIIPLYLRPAFSIASGALLASFLFSLNLSLPFLISITILALFVIFLFCDLKGLLKFLISFAIVSISAILVLSRAKQLDISDNCGVIVKVHLRDYLLAGENIEEIGNPYYTRGIIRELRFSQKDTSPLLLNFPVAVEGLSKKYKLSYGDIAEIRGYLRKPEEALFEGDFDQKNFLLSRGFLYLLHPDEINIIGREKSIISKLLDLRNSLLERITSNIKSKENKKILAALLFGCRQGIDSQTRHKLLLAGTIHVIAISGLHVAIFAFLILVFLSALPFKWRYFLLPFFVFIYILSAGFQPSAVRAFLMITIWSWQKAAMYPETAYTALCYALAISLILTPFGVLDPGFQYSFIITAFLIAASRKINELQPLLFLQNNFVPDLLKLTFIQHIIFYLVGGVIICIIAFLAGLQVSLYNQNILNPLSIILNLLISPLLCVIFLLSFFTAVFPVGILPAILEIFTNLFAFLLTSFSETAFTLTTPHILLFLIFFSLPLVLLTFFNQSNRISISCCLSISIFLLVLWYLPKLRNTEIKVIHGGGVPPSIIIIQEHSTNVLLIDVPSRTHASKITEFLYSKGIYHIDTIFCTNSRLENVEGVPFLLSRFRCGELVFLSNPALSPYAKFASKTAGENLTKVSIRTPAEKISSKKYNAEKKNFKEISIGRNQTIRLSKLRTGETQISLITANSIHTALFKNSCKLYLSDFFTQSRKNSNFITFIYNEL